MLLMVLVFLLKDFCYSKAAGKDKLDAFMTKSASIKTGEIDEAIVYVTNNKVLQLIKSALVKYQVVKRRI
jgi:hypothetical protein